MTAVGLDLDSPFRVTLPPRPYPGLRPFDNSEWPIFFGRERMADAVVSQLVDKRVLVVHGDSGCGKSSLVRAAVLPRLEQEHARGGIRWRTCAATPGEEPLWNIAEALAGLGGGRPPIERTLEIRRALNLGPAAPLALAGLLREHVNDHICILLDQFEELFAHARRHGPEEAQLVAGLVVSLHREPPDGLYAVLTMRSEFLGACARFRDFAETVNATQYLLPQMGHADLVRAIREPAALYNGEVSQNLAERLIADAKGSQDQLPLIQHGLTLLHHRHAPPPAEGSTPAWRLGLEHYQHSGGLAQLLSEHADAVLLEAQANYLTPGSRLIEHLFRALTDINADGQAIRRPCTLDDLVAITGGDEATVRNVVEAFRREGVSFLKPYGSDPIDRTDLIDISHEALIRCWSKIADPKDGWLLDEFKSGLVWRALLVQAESFEQNPKNLLGPNTTDERERWIQRRTPAWTRRYGGGWGRVQKLLQASAAERDRHRAEQEEARRREEASKLREQRYRLIGLGAIFVTVLLLVAAGLAVTAWQASRRAAREAQIAREETRQAASYIESVQLARENAERDRQAAEAARAQSEAIADEAQRSARALQEVLQRLRAGSAAPSSQTVQYATDRLASVASELSGAAKATEGGVRPPPLPSATPSHPRVYIQIADAGQRAAAQAFESRLEAASLNSGVRVIVPGIEVVKASPRRSVLRCFRSEECDREGADLVKLVNSLLSAPQFVLEDLSGRYGASTTTRRRHYELWFADGPIEPRGARAR